ncbi:MAG: lipopolysaccharide assembly protein LapA domain-containing protein [Novosphingobium sp.]
MQVVRTVFWVLLTAVLVAFISINWNTAPVNFWPIGGGYLHFEWPVGVIALVFFLLGLLPMWLLGKAGKWRLNRRIGALENSVRANAAPPPTSMPPLATSSQLEAAAPPARSPESSLS